MIISDNTLIGLGINPQSRSIRDYEWAKQYIRGNPDLNKEYEDNIKQAAEFINI